MITSTGPSPVTRSGLIALTLCAIATAAQANPPRGAGLLQPFKHQLMNALQSGLQQGPAEAIDICRVKAPQIAASLAQDDVRMGRTSHRLRNPANEAPEWVEPLLKQFLEDEAAVRPREVKLQGGRMGYVEPIRVQKPCLICHGKELAPDVAERIERLYPEDQATGFSEGDLRGVFWVEYPADEAG